MSSRSMLCAVSLLIAISPIWADDNKDDAVRMMRASLSGTNEVPVNLSAGSGTVTLNVTDAPASISITIEYANLTGSATAAHLHLGNPWESGPIVVTICGTAGRQCPAQGSEQTFTFPLTGDAIAAVPAQGFKADAASLIRALESGVIYANVHTNVFPNGEIRGHVGHGRSRGVGNDNPGRGNGNGNGNSNDNGKGKN